MKNVNIMSMQTAVITKVSLFTAIVSCIVAAINL